MKVIRWSELPAATSDELLVAVKEIFFLSSNKKNFKDAQEREDFWDLWCGNYIKFYPHLFFLALNPGELGPKVQAYLAGCLDTLAQCQLFHLPSQECFEDLYKDFPAHLHINAHPSVRGQGVGSKLLQLYVNYLKLHKVRGVHLITGALARNVKFYESNGFNSTHLNKKGKNPLLFMGQKLSKD